MLRLDQKQFLACVQAAFSCYDKKPNWAEVTDTIDALATISEVSIHFCDQTIGNVRKSLDRILSEEWLLKREEDWLS